MKYDKVLFRDENGEAYELSRSEKIIAAAIMIVGLALMAGMVVAVWKAVAFPKT